MPLQSLRMSTSSTRSPGVMLRAPAGRINVARALRKASGSRRRSEWRSLPPAYRWVRLCGSNTTTVTGADHRPASRRRPRRGQAMRITARRARPLLRQVQHRCPTEARRARGRTRPSIVSHMSRSHLAVTGRTSTASNCASGNRFAISIARSGVSQSTMKNPLICSSTQRQGHRRRLRNRS